MKRTETIKLLSLISTAYLNFELTEERIELWHEFLRNFQFEKGLLHLKRHIETNAFPPTIADILKKDPNQYVDYEQLKLDTAKRFQQMDEWERKAVPPPRLEGGNG